MRESITTPTSPGAEFEELNGDFFSSTLESVEKALRDAKLDKSAIHDIVLVGGSTRIPKNPEAAAGLLQWEGAEQIDQP